MIAYLVFAMVSLAAAAFDMLVEALESAIHRVPGRMTVCSSIAADSAVHLASHAFVHACFGVIKPPAAHAFQYSMCTALLVFSFLQIVRRTPPCKSGADHGSRMAGSAIAHSLTHIVASVQKNFLYVPILCAALENASGHWRYNTPLALAIQSAMTNTLKSAWWYLETAAESKSGRFANDNAKALELSAFGTILGLCSILAVLPSISQWHGIDLPGQIALVDLEGVTNVSNLIRRGGAVALVSMQIFACKVHAYRHREHVMSRVTHQFSRPSTRRFLIADYCGTLGFQLLILARLFLEKVRPSAEFENRVLRYFFGIPWATWWLGAVAVKLNLEFVILARWAREYIATMFPGRSFFAYNSALLRARDPKRFRARLFARSMRGVPLNLSLPLYMALVRSFGDILAAARYTLTGLTWQEGVHEDEKVQMLVNALFVVLYPFTSRVMPRVEPAFQIGGAHGRAERIVQQAGEGRVQDGDFSPGHRPVDGLAMARTHRTQDGAPAPADEVRKE